MPEADAVGFLRTYSGITLELFVDYRLANVVERRFDAGIRLGEAISKDMIALHSQLVFNTTMHVLNSALDGLGLGYVPEHLVAPSLADGRLLRMLKPWSPVFEGFHLY